MTTDQTIDGALLVPRELAERITTWREGDEGDSGRHELRILLEAPEPTVFGCNRCGGTQAEWSAKCVHVHPAAQPQREPVALEVVGRQCFPSNAMKAVQGYRKEPWVDGDVGQLPSEPGLYHIEPLVRLSDIAMQPAPVVVARPERSNQDYAIEHAEYMAQTADEVLAKFQEYGLALLAVDEGGDDGEGEQLENIDSTRRDLQEALVDLRGMVYEFRKRAAKSR